MESILKIPEIRVPELSQPGATRGNHFADSLKEAILEVDELQKESEAAQLSFARGEDVDLHDVLIKIEEAEMTFKSMMEIRNKLIEAYQEVMRMGA